MAIIKTVLALTSIILVPSMLATVVAAPPTEGQVAYWTFDDGSGSTASDSSGNGNAATQTVQVSLPGVSTYSVSIEVT